MDTKGFEKKPWFPYLKNMYDDIEGDMMSVDAKGYEEKPWWPYVLDLQEKIEAGGGGGGDLEKATVTFKYARSGQGIHLVEMTLPLVIEGETGFEPCVMARQESVNNKEPLVVVVPIYKKKCVIIPGNKSFTLEGNCKAGEGNLEGTIIVSGDCSITYHD